MSLFNASAPERLTVGAEGKIVGGRGLVAVRKVPESQGLKLQWGSKLLRLGSELHVTSTAPAAIRHIVNSHARAFDTTSFIQRFDTNNLAL